jgi:hypothetical protein
MPSAVCSLCSGCSNARQCLRTDQDQDQKLIHAPVTIISLLLHSQSHRTRVGPVLITTLFPKHCFFL